MITLILGGAGSPPTELHVSDLQLRPDLRYRIRQVAAEWCSLPGRRRRGRTLTGMRSVSAIALADGLDAAWGAEAPPREAFAVEPSSARGRHLLSTSIEDVLPLGLEVAPINASHVPSVRVTIEVVVPTPMLVRQLIDKLRVDWDSPEAASAAFAVIGLPIIATPTYHRQMYRAEVCCIPPSPPPPSPPPSPPPPSPPPSMPPDLTLVAATSVSGGVIGAGIVGGLVFLALSAQAARKARALAQKRARARLKKSFATLSSASRASSGKGGLADIAMLSKLGKGGTMNITSMV